LISPCPAALSTPVTITVDKMELNVVATFTCDVCQRETRFLSVQCSVRSAGVCRSTIYYWMERGWIHWRELPSGRRIICHNSLSRPTATTGTSVPVSVPGAGFVKLA
jgi:predicted DNA-binding transcriptional regulator AlpA